MDVTPLQTAEPRARGFPFHLPALAVLALAAACTAPAGGGAERDGQEAGAPDSEAREMAIPAIQGRSHVSPVAGERVVATGVVTAVSSRGLYLQDPRGDGHTATSDALFVAAEPGAAAVGDRLRVTGRVVEHRPGGPETANLTVTRLEPDRLEVLSSGEPLPEPVRLGSGGRIPPRVEVIGDDELPVNLADPRAAAANEFDPGSEGIDFYESLEAMRVTVVEPVTVSPTETFDGGATAEVFTLVERGAHVAPDDARTGRGGIRLQPDPDNRGDHNPERVQIQFAADFPPGPPPTLAVGARLADVTGVVGYGFGNYEVLPTSEVSSEPSGLEPEVAGLADGAGAVTVASYNVLNLNPLPETAARLDRLAKQIVDALGAPGVLALQEIQDETGARGGTEDTTTDATATLEALVRAVVGAGGPRYVHADVPPAPNSSGGVPGGNIRNAFLYDTARVELLELQALDRAALAAAGAPDPEAFAGARDPLAGTFRARGDTFTVVNNHWTSRYGSTPVFGAVQPFVQAGEEARRAQALALHAWVDARLGEDPDARIAVVGDFNTFEFTDELDRLLPAGRGGDRVLHNLVADLPADTRYSYVFEGNSQALDHVFVTPALRAGAEVEAVHVNAEFPEGRRASDHEPLVARLRLR